MGGANISFSTDNAAFCDGMRNVEIAAVLVQLAKRIAAMDSSESIDWRVYDLNGNGIGFCRIEESE